MKNSFEILNSFVDSLAILDVNGTIIFTNHSWKLFSEENSGTISETHIGINYLAVCDNAIDKDSNGAKEASEGIGKVIKGELDLFEMEYPCHSISDKRWFILRVNKLANDSDLTIVSHINITKRKIAEELVEKTNNQLNEINTKLNSTLFKIVHDIQGPLNSVEGLIKLSKTKDPLDDTENYFSLIERCVFKLKQFIQETLELASIHGKVESVNFKSILEDFIDTIKYSELLNHVKIEFYITQKHKFFTYKSEIVSILSNLINNSLKYFDSTKEKPFIKVTVIVSKNQVEITVEDNGIGIAKEYLKHVFDLNFQVDKNSKSGAGVGLNLVKKSVEILNGQLDIQSDLGLGTKFHMVFPNKNK
jgi:signal transduction histidine kinase